MTWDGRFDWCYQRQLEITWHRSASHCEKQADDGWLTLGCLTPTGWNAPPVSTLQWRFIVADGSNLCQALLVGWKNLKSYLPCKHCEDSGDLSGQAWMRAKTNWEQRDQTQILYSDEYEGSQLHSCCRTLNTLFESALGPFFIDIPISVFPPCWFHSVELKHIVVFFIVNA